MDIVVAKDRQRGSSECQDPRTREGDMNVVEDGLFQRNVGASHPRGNLVVHVDDVVAGPPIIPRLSVRQGPRIGRLQTPACDPPRGGHNLLCPGESQVERGRARLAAPGVGRGRDQGSWPRVSPRFRSRRSSASNTIPASTVAVPEAASIERTRRMFRRSRTIESNVGRAPPMRPVPPPHGTSFNPASTTKRTTVTTSSTDGGKTTAAGGGRFSSKREPRCARNASV